MKMHDYETVLTSEKCKWNEIVKQFENYEVHYLCEYVEAFEALGSDKAFLWHYDNGKTKAVNVMFLRDIANADVFKGKIASETYFDLQSPYGYGGMLIEGEDVISVWESYEQFCREKNIVCEFVRFNLFSHSECCYCGESESRTHNIVRSLGMPIDEMMADFEHKVRKNVKKAIRNGLEIIIDSKGEYLESFLDIYYKTMERNEASESFFFPRSFFEKFVGMSENAVWFYVKKDENIISTELVIYNETNCYSYLGGTLSEYFEYRPNEFLKLEIIKWAQDKGIKNFVLGGGYGEDDGIFRYKKSFAPEGVVDFYIGTKVFNEEVYNQLVAIRCKEDDYNKDTKYFPSYRG